MKSRKAFAIAFDGVVDPVSNWNSRALVGIVRVDVTLFQRRSSFSEAACHKHAEKRICSTRLHCEEKGKQRR